jgi:gliding motility-associated-like protein
MLIAFISTSYASGGCDGDEIPCSSASPFCTGTTYDFPNETNTCAPEGPSYGCLSSQPNPVWYYMEIDQSGTLLIDLEQTTGPNGTGSGIDVDFALWGPYTDLTIGCDGVMNGDYPIQCSYSTAATETIGIGLLGGTGSGESTPPSAVNSEVYILLITNYADEDGYINFSQTGGTGSTNCDIVVPCQSTNAITNPICNGGTGSIQITATDGVPNFNVSWSGVSNGAPAGDEITALGGTYTIPNLSAGSYTIEVLDGDGCINTHNVDIVDPPALNVSLTMNPSVCGDPNGSIDVLVSNASDPINYTWYAISGGATTNDNISGQASSYSISGLEPSVYQVDVVDANGCTASATVEVENSGEVTASFTVSPNQCLEGNVFDFVNTSVATTGITYEIISPSLVSNQYNGTPDFTGFTAYESGIWTITQTISSGTCSDQLTQYFTLYDDPTISETHQNVTCYGFADGEIIASSDISGAYTMLTGSGTFTGNTASDLVSGTYTFMITTADGCDDTLTVDITEPDEIVLQTSFTDVNCFGACDGTMSVSVLSGGVGPFLYDWGAFGSSDAYIDVCAGSYSVTVIDQNTPMSACFKTAEITISEPLEELYSISMQQSNCGQSDGLAIVQVASAVPSLTYNYRWYNQDYSQFLSQSLNNTNLKDSLQNQPAGVYNVIVENNNGCTDTLTISITDTGAPTIALSSSQDILCHGESTGSVSVSLSGTQHPDFTYFWYLDGNLMNTNGPTSQTNDQMSNLAAGDYEIVVEAVDGCQATLQISLTEPTMLYGSTNVINAMCTSPGQITASVGGGVAPYQFHWTDNQTTALASDLFAGHYTCTVTDNNACQVSLEADVIDASDFSTSIELIQNISCNAYADGILKVTPVNGTAPYTYTWSDGYIASNIGMRDNLIAGNYSVTIEDVNGCVSIESETLTEPTVLLSEAFVESPTCFGYQDGRAWVSTTGGTSPYNYLWSNGNCTENNVNIESNYYNVIVVDQNGCSNIINGIYISEPQPVVLALNYAPTICIGQTAEISMSATSSPFSPYTYYWNGIQSNDHITVSPVETTSYFAQVIDAHGCESAIRDVTVAVNPPLSLLAVPDKTIICKGDIVDVSLEASGGNGNYSYRLADGTSLSEPVQLSPETDREYIVIVSDDCGSPKDTAIFNIEVKSAPLPSFHAEIRQGCVPLEIDFVQDVSYHEEGTTYYWDFGDESTSNVSLNAQPNHLYNFDGSFHVSLTIKNSFGCQSSVLKADYIHAYPVPVAQFEPDPNNTTIINPSIYFINESQGSDAYIWDFGDGNTSSIVSPIYKYSSIPMEYDVTLIALNRFSCSDTLIQRVYINEEITIFIPNAFTPNFDGRNEFFVAKGNGIVNEGFNMSIYNRWGELIYTSDDINVGWDGRAKGNQLVKEDVYSYYIKYIDVYGISHEKTGVVNVIR